MEHRPVSLSAYWKLVRTNRNFRLLWTAQIISELGDWFYSIAIYSLLLELTGSAKAVALAVVLQVLPQFFISPGAGVVTDRMSRKKIMILADVARAVIVLGLLFVQRPELVWCIYVLMCASTMMWAFFEPARAATIPNLTRREEVLVANTLSSTTWSVTLAVGSALGGIVAVVFGRNTVFLVNAVTFLISARLLQKMSFHEPHTSGTPPMKAGDLADFSPVKEGVRYVAKDRRLLATLLLKAGLGFMGTNWVILPLLGERVFPVGVDALEPQRAAMLGMSILMGARGVGALLGPLIGSYVAGYNEARMRVGILTGFLAGAFGYMALGIAPALWLAFAAVVLSNAGGSIIWVFSTTLLHKHTEDRYRGRVFAADYALFVLSVSVVNFLAGALIDLGLSVQALAVFTGVFGVGPAVAWSLALRLWRDPAHQMPAVSEEKR